MPFFSSLAKRIRVPEDIDDPNLPSEELQGALRCLTCVNALSTSAGTLWRPIAALSQSQPGRTLRILDVATGAGDIPRALWRKATASGLKVEILGVDISERSLDFARERAKAAGAKVGFDKLDVFKQPMPRGFDVVMCSLFLHHLDEQPAIDLLRAMGRAAEQMVLVNDLRRNSSGLLLAYLASRLLTRSAAVRVDALRSVRAAFTLDEVLKMSDEAGLTGATVRPTWPSRYLLTWRRGTERA